MNRLVLAAPLLATSQAASPDHCFRIVKRDSWGWNAVEGDCVPKSFLARGEGEDSPNHFDDKWKCIEASKNCPSLKKVTDVFINFVKKKPAQKLQQFLNHFFVDDAKIFFAAKQKHLTPLQYAVKRGKVNIVRTLLEHMDQVCEKDTTRYLDAKQLKFKYLQARNKKGRTALDIAKKLQHTEIIALLQDVLAANKVIPGKAISKLATHMEKGKVAEFKKLLEREFTEHVNVANFLSVGYGFSRLSIVHWALYFEHQPILEALLDHLKNVYGQNEKMRAHVKFCLEKKMWNYNTRSTFPLVQNEAQTLAIKKYLKETAMSSQLRV